MLTDKIRIAELTSEESRQFLNEDAVILLPMGSLEDQGTHAPMGDYLAADLVAMDIARAARADGIPTFVAPVIPFGGADYFGSSHGGIALSQSTLTAVIDDMFACLSRHGLKKVMVINGHGGNVQAINEVSLRWRQKTGMFVCSLYLWQVSYEILKQILGPEAAAKSSGHGGDPLTSVGLHYYPELLRPDMMYPPVKSGKAMGLDLAGFAKVRYKGAVLQAPLEALESTATGVWGGDPKLCSAETGKAVVEKLVEIGAGFVRDHVAKGYPE